MIVKCTARSLYAEQIEALGSDYFADQEYHVTVGKSYTVYGLDFVMSKNIHVCNVYYISDYGHLSSAPITLFEIIQPSLSKTWITKNITSDWIAIWPPSFFQEYYHDDLSEGVPHVVEDFRRLGTIIEHESNNCA